MRPTSDSMGEKSAGHGSLAVPPSLRQVALGRNNWTFLGSAAGGHTAATLYSIVATCRQLGADPFAYLRAVLPAVFEMGDQPSDVDLSAWLPDTWLARRLAPAALAG